MSDGITDMMNELETVFHKRESGIEFTQIMIRKLFRNNYVAEFKFKYPGLNQEIETSIHSDSVSGCIFKVSKFFQTELTPGEITVI